MGTRCSPPIIPVFTVIHSFSSVAASTSTSVIFPTVLPSWSISFSPIRTRAMAGSLPQPSWEFLPRWQEWHSSGDAVLHVEPQPLTDRVLHLLGEMADEAGCAGQESEATHDGRREAQVGEGRAGHACPVDRERLAGGGGVDLGHGAEQRQMGQRDPG